MASNVDIIYDRLMADTTLVGILQGVDGVDGYSGLLQGGVWTRRLKREPPGQTPQAFYVSDKGKLIRPSCVILDRGDTPHQQRDAIPAAYVQTVTFYLYAQATATGKTAIKDSRRRMYTLLDKWVFATEDGPIAFLEYSDRIGVVDSEEFTEAVYDTVRYRITSRNANEV